MSRYIQLDDEEETPQVSSNAGWTQFTEWVDSLDSSEFPALAELVEQGETSEAQNVSDQIEVAMEETPPIPDVQSICETLKEVLAGHEGVATIV
jgi:hypothetical protein